MSAPPRRMPEGSTDDVRAERSALRRALRPIALIGPGFIAGTWQFGPGSLTTSVQAGNAYGYQLLWVIVISTLISIAFTDMSVRIAIRSDRSIVNTAKLYYGRWVGFGAGFGVFLLTLIFSVGNAVAAGASLSILFGGPPPMWMGICTLAVVFVAFARNVYRVLERMLIALLAIMAVGFVASALMTSPEWDEIGQGMVPTVPPGSELLIIALAGTNFSINAAFYISYAVRERKVKEEQYREVTLTDTIPGIGAPGVMAIFVVAAAVAANRGGEPAQSVGDLGSALEPIAGPAASTLFVIGFFAAAFSSMVANSMASGTVLSDALGWGSTLESGRIRCLVMIPLAFGGTVSIVAGSNPVSLIISAQALTVVVAPLVGSVILMLACRKDLMGSLALRPWLKVFGLFGFVVLMLLSLRLILTWLS